MKKLTKIAPLETLSLVDKVEIRLKEYFKENKLTVGDSIPKELEFAEAMGVSRTVIREALLRLRTIGVIESKKHKGMVLTQPDIIQNFEKAIEYNLLGDKALKEIFELRLTLEMGMADILFARKTAEDIKELNKIVEKEEKEERNTTVFSLENEVAFHGKLYQMSKNSTLQRFQELLLPVFQYVHDTKLPKARTYEYSSGEFVTHRDLLNILTTGTAEEFRKAMRQHLEPHFASI
ncbi:FadR/GntR family transcriptional regulator [Tenacibaculum maritimum]|uniref:FadR/GntR family transcriptional regulator n=1 Tax=Tenacibaculum maritimum TaxID=107401 RepID=UPI0012E69083|nr:FCD domain-containing protein [Tenacibaculum maritimum]MCD9562538.1 FCD domain-containing protein [Tenacibaculum maritimum]MCD9564917.1 FCD domain-containing protein [Tenacibaculum maritimum]MCD9577696.1 FCD domain-containing protein [Tenacibaculum maritimum]MCD9581206.1 FCD domain-containing protein [Tenacibaculum maritimum]MCD9583718.1 FCD domain-containing protein [Tenacibaculum maritimum]